MNLRESITDIFMAGLNAVLPENLIRGVITFTDDGLTVAGRHFPMPEGWRVHVFGSGKASIEAAKVLEDLMGDRIEGGLIVSNYHRSPPAKIELCIGSHPVPDEKSLIAANRLTDALSGLSEDDFFIYLLSGGSSSLIEKPLPPLTVEDLQTVSRLLMNSGASIEELNAVRKHLSMIKGGRLAQMTRARGVVLVISDVIGDDLETIGSAPFYRDRSSYRDVAEILSKYDLYHRVPVDVKALVEKGLSGKVDETPKELPLMIEHIVAGSNIKALRKSKERATSLGINTHIMTSRLRGEAREIAKAIIALGEEILSASDPLKMPVCLIFGGETTVTVRGKGKGGRNQEMCLSALKEIGNRSGIVFLSAGTDGIDGNSDAAGAAVDCRSYDRAQSLGLNIDDYLKGNDSNTLFEQTGDLIITGPTGTNVMDITILLAGGNKL